MRLNSITVITVTRGRANLLGRALESVRKQDYPGPIRHLVVIDDCSSTLRYLEQNAKSDAVAWLLRKRRSCDERIPGRLGRLRNDGVGLATTYWISFLDDDNEFHPNHLSSLMTAAALGECSAAHSYRELLWPDGSPYLEPLFPWCSNETEAARIYEHLRHEKVFEPGLHIMRDRVDPLDHAHPIRFVDTSEWLLSKETAMRFPFPAECSLEDWAAMKTEDDYLLEKMVSARIPIACNGLATLKYYLGGYSNSWLRRRFHWTKSADSGRNAVVKIGCSSGGPN